MGTTVWPILVIAVLFGLCKGDSNVGCLFSEELCVAEIEWCFDDGAFGRCINTNDLRDPQALYRHHLSRADLMIIEGELERMIEKGYRWSQHHTQCLLKALLYAFEYGTPLDGSKCHQYNGIDLFESLVPQKQVEPMAYIKFIPNAGDTQSDYADEVYYPPSADDGLQEYIMESKEQEGIIPFIDRRSDQHLSSAYNGQENIRSAYNGPENIMSAYNGPENIRSAYNGPENIRSAYNGPENIRSAYNGPENFRSAYEVNDLPPQEEIEEEFEHYRKFERPYAALRSLASLPSPDEFESRRKELDGFDPEKLSESLRNILRPSFALFKAPANNYGENDGDEIEYELENKKERIIEYDDDGKGYSEGGTVDQEEGDSLPDFIDKLNGALGFKRRERLDVKKPGPPYDPAFQVHYTP